MKTDEVTLFRATSLIRQLACQGVTFERAVQSAVVAYDTSPTVAARYAKAALDGAAQARADLAAASARTQKLNTAKERRAIQRQPEGKRHETISDSR